MKLPVLLWIVTLASLAAGIGCRDLVTPEEEIPAPPPFEIRVFGLGGVLDAAGVTLDNSAYVPASDAVRWTEYSILGSVVFERAPGSPFDLTVVPATFAFAGSGTPAWTAVGLVATDSILTVQFEGTPVEVQVSWPWLDDFPGLASHLSARFYYWLSYPPPDTFLYDTSLSIPAAEDGRIVGRLPYPGRYHLHMTSVRPGFDLDYHYADSLEVDLGGIVIPADPVRRAATNLVAGDHPLAPGLVRIVHYDGRGPESTSHLEVDMERTSTTDSLYLLDVGISQLKISAVTAPLFMPVSLFVSSWDQVPDTIDVGGLELVVRCVDAAQQPVPDARVTLRGESEPEYLASWVTDELRILARPGRYQVEATASGYEARNLVVDLAGDMELNIELLAL